MMRGESNTWGGGLTYHDFGYGRATGVPGPHPIHILGEVKKHTHSYTSHSENNYCTHNGIHIHVLFFKFYPII